MKSKSRRFYYPAGIISLILLPILCIWHLKKNHAFDEKRLLTLSILPRPEDESYDLFMKDYHPSIHFTDILLTENDTKNQIMLDSAQLLIRNLVQSQDTTIGVHFHFSDQTKFKTFISSIDICKIEKAVAFIPYENDLWVVNPRPQKSSDEYDLMTCGGSVCDIEQEVDLAKQLTEERWKKIIFVLETMKYYLVSILLFVLLIFISIRKLRRIN